MLIWECINCKKQTRYDTTFCKYCGNMLMPKEIQLETYVEEGGTL